MEVQGYKEVHTILCVWNNSVPGDSIYFYGLA